MIEKCADCGNDKFWDKITVIGKSKIVTRICKFCGEAN